jgi:hypothetical protein
MQPVDEMRVKVQFFKYINLLLSTPYVDYIFLVLLNEIVVVLIKAALTKGQRV